ncbi:MAG: hypothetical protein N2442_03325, partial [Spirochaetes bacterium]|nr:hypothetical protein [Spirochaetota bacterium]
MPKIEVKKERFYRLIGKTYDRDTLEAKLTFAKGEVDDVDEQTGVLKLELNDTNRPDLWSTAGLARFLRILETGRIPEYTFFSRPDASQKDAALNEVVRKDGSSKRKASEKEHESKGIRTVVVDPTLKDIRPYIAAFAVQGPPV